MTKKTRGAYEEFLGLIRQIYDLGQATSVIGWDQHTNLPPKAAPMRAAQLATLTGIVHDWMVAPRLHELLGTLEAAAGELDADATVNVREIRRLVNRARKIPRDLVTEITKTESLSQQHWVAARQKSDFAHFAPWLEKILALKLQEAEALGYEKTPYNALLDAFEPQTTADEIAGVFEALRPRLVEIVRAIGDSGVTPKREYVRRAFPIDRQREFGLWIIRRLGFDMQAGRVDTSPHPFTSGDIFDVRLTTRYDERFLPMSLFGLIHEAGHGMYDQGLDPEHQSTPRAMAVSSGIHESQSRMWENLVARSLPFWQFAFPYFQAFFPDQTGDMKLEEWYAAVNDVRPSLIRVEADEVTYNLHIILRFEIERALVEKRISVSDLPGVWNEKMQEYLGVTPPNDGEGVLQDIHWSMGLFGYFPSYALGNLYAAQFFACAREAIPELIDRIGAGDFAPLKSWLNHKIHRRGRTYRAPELVQEVTGKPLSADYLIDHLRGKFGPLYGKWS